MPLEGELRRGGEGGHHSQLFLSVWIALWVPIFESENEKKIPVQQLSTKPHGIKSLEEKASHPLDMGCQSRARGWKVYWSGCTAAISADRDRWTQWGSDYQENKIGNEKPQRASKSKWNFTEREPVFYSKSSVGLECMRSYFSNWGQHDFITKDLFSPKTRGVVRSKV